MSKPFPNEAIVLAGGLGTRLRSVVANQPKPMAIVNETPFLSFIFEFLIHNKIEKVILSVGYQWECIREYFGDYYKELSIAYSIEQKPLGTGGATKRALSLATNESIYVLNGDTLFLINLQDLAEYRRGKPSDIVFAAKTVEEPNRYGALKIAADNPNQVVEFSKIGNQSQAYINGGIYLINKDFFKQFDTDESFGLEAFFECNISKTNAQAYICDGFFIDIGTPESYFRAQKLLPSIDFMKNETSK